MESNDRLAGDIAECLHYIVHFCLRPSAVGGGAAGTSRRYEVPKSLIEAKRACLIPEAEYVTIEWAAVSLTYQPPDVRAVLGRLMRSCETLAADPTRAAAVASSRRLHFPGVLEGQDRG